MIRTEESLILDLMSTDRKARAAALEELVHSEQPVAGELRTAVEAVRDGDGPQELKDRAAGVLAIADAQSRINRVRKTWGATLNPMLLGSILRNPNTAVRKKAVDTLRSKDPRAFAATVAERLPHETDPGVLAGMIALLARTNDREYLRALDGAIDREDPAVALPALETFIKLAGDEWGPTLIARLEKLVADHPSADVRFLARRSLSANRELTAPDGAALSADQIVERLPAEKDVKALARLVSQLKDAGGPQHADAVRPLLKHADDRVCANAVETFVKLSGAVSVDSLLPLLARDDNRLKANLMLALRDQYRLQVEGYVRRMLRAERFSYRISALYCARYLDLAEIYPDVLRQVSEEKNTDVLAAGLAWLAEYGAPARAAQDLADLALVRPDAAAAVRAAQARLQARAPEVGEVAARAPSPPATPAPAPEPAPTSERPLSHPERLRADAERPPLPRTRPGTRPVVSTRPDREPPPSETPSLLADPRVAVALAVTALLSLVAFAALQMRGVDEDAPRERTRPAAQVSRPAKPTPLRGVITAVSGPEDAIDVEVKVRNQTYDLRWPASAGPRPAVGDPVFIGSLHVLRLGDGSYKLTAEKVERATR